MRALSTSLIEDVFATLKVNKGLRKRLSLASFNAMTSSNWDNFELISLPTKDGVAGVLFIELDDKLYALPYEIGVVGDRATGRSKPVICDFCKTWQAGGRAGSITFRPQRRLLNSISFLCCLDLSCSLHVRNMTVAAKTSRAQLREDVTQEDRIERLKSRLSILVDQLQLDPVIIYPENTDR